MKLNSIAAAVTMSLGLIFLFGPAAAPAVEPDLRVLADTARFPQPEMMLYDYLTRLVEVEMEKRDAAIGALRTPSDWSGRRDYVRRVVSDAIGAFPPKTPMHPVITGVYRGDGFRVEKIIYQSRPNLYVTANLYLPDPVTSPVPAFINPVGHWHQGKANDTYRHLGAILAKRGYAAFIYDPIGQGERLQYYNPDTGVTFAGDPVFPHNIVGKQCLLTDINLTNYFLWDGVRAIDYLETRSEIDASRIVCAGASGGGAQTQFISPLEDRIKISIPVVSVGREASTKSAPFRGGIGDNEQNLFWSLDKGIVRADWLGCLAPIPLFIIAASGDRGGTTSPGATFHETRRLYHQFGADSLKVEELIFYGEHGWPDEVVMATADFTDKWFGRAPIPVELPVNPPPRDSVICTETGQVVTSLGGETIFSLVRERAAEIAPKPPRIRNAKDVDTLARETRGEMVRLTGYRPAESKPRIERLGSVRRGDIQIDKLLYYPEPEVYVPALLFKPAAAGGKLPGILYLPQGGGAIDGTAVTTTDGWSGPARFETGGKDRRAAPGDLLESLTRSGCAVLAVDYRGIGETLVRPGSRDLSDTWFNPGNFGAEAGTCYLMLRMGRTLFGLRLVDTIAGLDVLAGMDGVDPARIGVAGHSMGGLLALYTAALDPRVKAALVERSLVSYRSLVETPLYYFHFNVFVPGVLGHYDLDDVAAMLAPRPLTFINPVDQQRTRLAAPDAAGRYPIAASAYKALKGEGSLRFTVADSPAELAAIYHQWKKAGLD